MSTTATQCVRCERYHGESSSCVILPGNARCERCVIEVSTFDAADRIVIDDAVPALEIPVDDNARWMLVKPAAKKMASNAGKAITTKVAPQLNRTVARKSAPNKDEDEDVTKSLSAPAPHRTFPCVARKTAPASPPKVTKKSTAPAPRRKKKMTKGEIRDSFVKIHSAAEDGDLDELDRLRIEYEGRITKTYSKPFKWDTDLIMCVARDGKEPIKVISWALEHGARIDVNASKGAVEREYHVDRENAAGVYQSSLDVLKFLHKTRPETCNEDTLHCACEFGRTDCVKYCVENVRGCYVPTWRGSKTPKMKKNNLMLIAAQNGHLDVLKYLHDEAGCFFEHPYPDEAISLVMNRQPSAPPGWWRVVMYIQSTAEWRKTHPNWTPILGISSA